MAWRSSQADQEPRFDFPKRPPVRRVAAAAPQPAREEWQLVSFLADAALGRPRPSGSFAAIRLASEMMAIRLRREARWPPLWKGAFGLLAVSLRPPPLFEPSCVASGAAASRWRRRRPASAPMAPAPRRTATEEWNRARASRTIRAGRWHPTAHEAAGRTAETPRPADDGPSTRVGFEAPPYRPALQRAGGPPWGWAQLAEGLAWLDAACLVGPKSPIRLTIKLRRRFGAMVEASGSGCPRRRPCGS
jgi:hypothetical protein